MNKKIPHKITHKKLSANLPDVIKISTFGMDERSIQRISAMFTIIFKGRCELVSPNEAMIALIDINEDSVAENIMESNQETNNNNPSLLPSIVLVKTSQNSDNNNVRYLEKPLKREDFWQAIISLFEQQEELKLVAKKIPKINTSDSAGALDNLISTQKKGPIIAQLVKDKTSQSIFYNPEKHLIGYLQKLLAQSHPDNSVLKLEFAYKYRLFLYPDLNLALSNISDRGYRNIAIMPFTSEQICHLTIEQNANIEETFILHQNEFKKITFDSLLWSLSLRTSRGRVPNNTAINKPVYLHAWPNFTRLCRTPHAMRIASVWIDNPQTLSHISQSLDIDISDVYSFYSATLTLGISGKSKRESDVIIEAKPVKAHKKRGLFGAILNRLRGKSTS
jgi:hypothetical protein